MEWSRLLEVSRFKFQDSTQLAPLSFTSQSADSPSGFATNRPNGILVRERGDSKDRRHLSCQGYPCAYFCYGHMACLGRKDTAATNIKTGVVERIHIHRHPTAMLGQSLATGNTPIAETRRIVIRHGTLIGGVIIVNQAHTGYGIFCLV